MSAVSASNGAATAPAVSAARCASNCDPPTTSFADAVYSAWIPRLVKWFSPWDGNIARECVRLAALEAMDESAVPAAVRDTQHVAEDAPERRAARVLRDFTVPAVLRSQLLYEKSVIEEIYQQYSANETDARYCTLIVVSALFSASVAPEDGPYTPVWMRLLVMAWAGVSLIVFVARRRMPPRLCMWLRLLYYLGITACTSLRIAVAQDMVPYAVGMWGLLTRSWVTMSDVGFTRLGVFVTVDTVASMLLARLVDGATAEDSIRWEILTWGWFMLYAMLADHLARMLFARECELFITRLACSDASSMHRLLSESTMAMICVHDLDGQPPGRLLYVSSASLQVVGKTREQLRHADLCDYVHPDDLLALQDVLRDYSRLRCAPVAAQRLQPRRMHRRCCKPYHNASSVTDAGVILHLGLDHLDLLEQVGKMALPSDEDQAQPPSPSRRRSVVAPPAIPVAAHTLPASMAPGHAQLQHAAALQASVSVPTEPPAHVASNLSAQQLGRAHRLRRVSLCKYSRDESFNKSSMRVWATATKYYSAATTNVRTIGLDSSEEERVVTVPPESRATPDSPTAPSTHQHRELYIRWKLPSGVYQRIHGSVQLTPEGCIGVYRVAPVEDPKDRANLSTAVDVLLQHLRRNPGALPQDLLMRLQTGLRDLLHSGRPFSGR